MISSRVGSEWWKRQQKELFAITDEADFTPCVMMGFLTMRSHEKAQAQSAKILGLKLILEAALIRGSLRCIMHVPIPVIRWDVGVGFDASYGYCDNE